jgi:hypothetical protein
MRAAKATFDYGIIMDPPSPLFHDHLACVHAEMDTLEDA